MISGPLLIEDSDLARAWAKAFLALHQPGVAEISPLLVTITGFRNNEPQEDTSIRKLVDHALAENGQTSIEVIAKRIFPQSKWDPMLPAQALYYRYLQSYSRLKHLGPPPGYFSRMTAYSPRGTQVCVNQLQHVITTWRSGNHRRSAHQLAIFDPTRDHTNQRRRGFPCLNQIALSPTSNGALIVTAFYATQTIFRRAYGNYLGLARLGKFLAHEMGLELTRVTCIASVAQQGLNKERGRSLAEQLRPSVNS
jgi:thymidylate synthase